MISSNSATCQNCLTLSDFCFLHLSLFFLSLSSECFCPVFFQDHDFGHLFVCAADVLAHAFDVLKVELKSEVAKELFLYYQATPVITHYLKPTNKVSRSLGFPFLCMEQDAAASNHHFSDIRFFYPPVSVTLFVFLFFPP